MMIREATPDDFAAIDELVASAFGRADEAQLVRTLRAHDSILELVALDGRMLGHVMYSRVWIESDLKYPAAQLAPLAVVPDRQKSGIGGALMAEGFQRLKRAGETHIFVLGHRDYYPRFGFSPDAAAAFQSPWPRPSFMLARMGGGPASGKLIVPTAFL